MTAHGAEIVLVAALTRNRVIGSDGDMPWHLPEDLKRFKAITLGHPVVMGRRTFESIGRPLPGRTNLVVSRDPHYTADGIEVVSDLDEALRRAATLHSRVMVIGGGQIYAQALPLADRLELTHLDRDLDGDTYFPEIDPDLWQVEQRDDRDGYSFVTWVRSPGH